MKLETAPSVLSQPLQAAWMQQCPESHSYQQAWVLHAHQESKWTQAPVAVPNTAFSEVATGSILDTMKWISRSNKVYQSNSTWCKKHHLTNIYIFFKVFYPTRNWKSWGEGLEWTTKYCKLKWELRGFQCPLWRLQKGAAIPKQWSGKILDGRN